MDGPFNWLRRSGNGFLSLSAKLGITAGSLLELEYNLENDQREQMATSARIC